MTTDPREVFRLPAKNCGSCAHWWRDLIVGSDTRPKHASGSIELPCQLHGRPYRHGESNYENGWRRASDSCGKWEKLES